MIGVPNVTSIPYALLYLRAMCFDTTLWAVWMFDLSDMERNPPLTNYHTNATFNEICVAIDIQCVCVTVVYEHDEGGVWWYKSRTV